MKRIFGAILAATLVLAGCGDGGRGAANQAAPANLSAAAYVTLFNQGVVQLEQHQFFDAARIFGDCVRARPDHAAAWINYASAELNRNTLETHQPCLEACARATTLDPRAPQPGFFRGILLKHLGRSEEAEAAFRDVLRLAPDDPTTLYHLATVVAEHDVPAAVALFERALQGETHLSSAVYALAGLKRRTDRAAQDELLSLFKAFERAETGNKVRIIYTEMGRLGEAIRDLPTSPAPAAAPPPDWAAAFHESTTVSGRLAAVIDGGPSTVLATLDAQGRPQLSAADGRKLGPGPTIAAAPEAVQSLCSVDLSQDGIADLVLVAGGMVLQYRGSAQGYAAAPLPAVPGVIAACATDIDQDADVDLVLLTETKDAANVVTHAVVILRNQRDGTFVRYDPPAAATSRPGGAFAPPPLPPLVNVARVCATDLDLDGDPDLVFSGPDGIRIWRNDRLMRFTDVTARAGLDQCGPVTAFLVEDVDGDRLPDLVTLGRETRLWRQVSHGPFRLTFEPRPPLQIAGAGAIELARLADLDNDGRDELVLAGADGVRILPAEALLGGAPNAALLPLPAGLTLGHPRTILVADVDHDLAPDLVIGGDQSTVVLFGTRTPGRHALDVRLAGRIDPGKMRANAGGLGARVEVMTGTRFRQQELRASDGMPGSPASTLHFGLGDAGTADYVRITWPDDVLQSEGPVPGDQRKVIEEFQRKGSSCPLLFSWDGAQWEMVTDFLGVGGLGFALGPGTFGPPDPTEMVLIPHVVLRQGRVALRVHEPFEEVCYLDRLRLLAVDHPASVEVVPDERFAINAPNPDGRLLAIAHRQVPLHAQDNAGRDVTAAVGAIDRIHANTKPDPRFIGFAEPSALTFDFGAALQDAATANDVYLGLDGWVEYPYSQVNIAATQAGLRLEGLGVDLETKGGQWVKLLDDACYPAGMPRTMTLPLGVLPANLSGRLRLRTNQELWIDRLWIARPVEAGLKTTALDPLVADLRFTGYPREYSPDGRPPRLYDGNIMDPSFPWKTLAGAFTRFGDVRELLTAADDCYVVFGGGEEIELEFEAPPPPPPGFARTYVLDTFGWCKDMDPHTAYPYTVEPLPFRGMSNYPYRDDEHFPDGAAQRSWKARYQTRVLPGTRSGR